MKPFTLILALLMLLLLVGCNDSDDTTEITQTTETLKTTESSDTLGFTESSNETTNVSETVLQIEQPNTEDTSGADSTDTESQNDVTSINTTTDDPTEVSEPEQTHVGVWYTDTQKQQYIRITRMKSDKIVFSAKPYPDALHFSIHAVKQGDEYVFGKDISPLNTDRLAEKNLSGKLILEDNGVKLIYNPSDLWETEIVQQFTIKNEVDKIDLSKGDLPIGISEKLQSIIDKLSNVGWTDFEVIPHEPDSKTRWGGLILDSYDLPTNAKLYCVTARTKLVYVNVYAVFEGEEQIDEVIYYVSISGRVMEKNYLENFMQRNNCDIIIPANNEDMFYYFESY